MKAFNLFLFVLLTSHASHAIIFGSDADTRPMPKGACAEDHNILLEQFAEKNFETLRNSGKVGMDDKYDMSSAIRQNHTEQMDQEGMTPYELRSYATLPDGEFIKLDGDSGSPDKTNEYGCFGHLVVTSSCEVIMVSTDFMSNDKLEESGKMALEELKRKHEREGTELPIDEKGYVAVGVPVPKVQGMTCNRPHAQVFF